MQSDDPTVPQLPCDLEMQSAETQLHSTQPQLWKMAAAAQSRAKQDTLGLQSFAASARNCASDGRGAKAAKLEKLHCLEAEHRNTRQHTSRTQHTMQRKLLHQTAQQIEEVHDSSAVTESAAAAAPECAGLNLTSSQDGLAEPKRSSYLQQTKHETGPAEGATLRKRRPGIAALQGPVKRSLRIRAAS